MFYALYSVILFALLLRGYKLFLSDKAIEAEQNQSNNRQLKSSCLNNKKINRP